MDREPGSFYESWVDVWMWGSASLPEWSTHMHAGVHHFLASRL